MQGSQETIWVVGAGISGLCAAVFLARAGRRVEVWEAAAQPGGLLQPQSFRGMPCDLGSHRVHGDALPILRAAAPELAWLTRPRRGSLIFCSSRPAPRAPPFAAADDEACRHVPYPLRLGGFLRGLGPLQAARFGLSFLRREASLRKYLRWEADRSAAASYQDPDADPGFAAFVRERTGEAAFQSFYRPYVEKVWGLPAEEISGSVAKKRVSTAKPLAVLRESLQAVLQPQRQGSGTYLYPVAGIAALIQGLAEQAQALGVRVHYRRSLGRAELAAHPGPVVYTGHLADLTAPAAPAAPAFSVAEPGSSLAHRGLYLVYLAFPGKILSDVDTFYIPGRSLWFGRVSVPGNFAPDLAPATESLLCVEIPEGTWGRERDFVAPEFLAELLRQLSWAGILPTVAGQPPQPAAVQQVFLPRVYPLYRRGWLAAWRRELASLAAQPNLFPAGRQGLFLHCNIDHCVQIAQDLSQHLLAGRDNASWLAHCERYLDVRVRD